YANLAVGNHLTLHHAFVGTSLILTARPTVDGDVSVDGIVNGQDLALLASNWLAHGVAGDVNDDGFVNGQDLGIIASNWLRNDTAGSGSSAAVPEPGTLVLTMLGGLAWLARWRRARQIVGAISSDGGS